MKQLLIIIFLTFSAVCGAQEAEELYLAQAEDQLRVLFDSLYRESDLIDKSQLSGEITNTFRKALETEGSFEYDWVKLNKIGRIKSEDGKLKIFTWHEMTDQNNYRYYGFFQVQQKNNNPLVYTLQDNPELPSRSKILDQSVDNWHGKLYYRILDTRHRRQTYYTLLGKDFNNQLSDIKTIEVISIRRNQLQFEKERIFDGADRSDRMVLEYSAQLAVTVSYNEQLKQIVFDHLIPLHPVYTGNYEFYGPDGSFDGLEFSNGLWILREDVDARNIY